MQIVPRYEGSPLRSEDKVPRSRLSLPGGVWWPRSSRKRQLGALSRVRFGGKFTYFALREANAGRGLGRRAVIPFLGAETMKSSRKLAGLGAVTMKSHCEAWCCHRRVRFRGELTGMGFRFYSRWWRGNVAVKR